MTDLHQLWPHTAHNVDVNQVWLHPDRPQARHLESRPPACKVLTVLAAIARVDLELELTDREHLALGVSAEEGCERVKLSAIDVDLEDIEGLVA